jgi:hypothetical protein
MNDVLKSLDDLQSRLRALLLFWNDVQTGARTTQYRDVKFLVDQLLESGFELSMARLDVATMVTDCKAMNALSHAQIAEGNRLLLKAAEYLAMSTPSPVLVGALPANVVRLCDFTRGDAS